MKSLIYGFALLLTFNVAAQWRFGLTYYQDTTYFNGGRANEYDATDMFAGWDDFVRLNVAYKFSEKHALDAWVDLNDSFSPSNFKLGYQYWHTEHFYVELAGMKQALFTIVYNDNDPFSGYGRYFSIYQFGAGAGTRKSFGILELSSSLHYLNGFSEREELSQLLYTDSNLKSLKIQNYRMKNLHSLNLELGAALKVFDRGNFSGGLMYKLVWRRDWFDYINEVQIFEWTESNKVSSEAYRSDHLFDHIQHHVGLIVFKK